MNHRLLTLSAALLLPLGGLSCTAPEASVPTLTLPVASGAAIGVIDPLWVSSPHRGGPLRPRSFVSASSPVWVLTVTEGSGEVEEVSVVGSADPRPMAFSDFFVPASELEAAEAPGRAELEAGLRYHRWATPDAVGPHLLLFSIDRLVLVLPPNGEGAFAAPLDFVETTAFVRELVDRHQNPPTEAERAALPTREELESWLHATQPLRELLLGE